MEDVKTWHDIIFARTNEEAHRNPYYQKNQTRENAIETDPITCGEEDGGVPAPGSPIPTRSPRKYSNSH